jgi:hypothetical protein
MLVECGGKIVTRKEIKSRLWGNQTIVDFEQGINSPIKALRRALGDLVDNPRYIETLGRRGYRLMLTIKYPESPTGSSTWLPGRIGATGTLHRCCGLYWPFPRHAWGAATSEEGGMAVLTTKVMWRSMEVAGMGLNVESL